MYSTVVAHGGFDNWQCIFIEKYPCSNPHELRARVHHWIEQLGANLNRVIAQNNTKPILAPKPQLLTVAQSIGQLDEKHETCLCGSLAKDFKHKSHATSIKHQNYLRSLVG